MINLFLFFWAGIRSRPFFSRWASRKITYPIFPVKVAGYNEYLSKPSEPDPLIIIGGRWMNGGADL